MSTPGASPSLGQRAMRDSSWPSLLLRHPQIEKPVFYLRESSSHIRCLTEFFRSCAAGVKRPADVFGGSHRRERREHGVFGHAARSFRWNWRLSLLRKGCECGFERSVSLSRCGDVHPSGTNFRRRRRNFWTRRFTGCRNCMPINCAAARLVANPGCYATSVILGLKAARRSGLDRHGARNRL